MSNDVLFKGGSLFLRYKDMYLFGIKKIDNDRKRTILTGIGGKVEKEESFRECSERESKEEIGQVPDIINSDKTLCIDAVYQKTYFDSVPEKPLIKVVRIAEGFCNTLIIYVFAAVIHSVPVISDKEFTYLIGLDRKTMRILGNGEKATISEAIGNGSAVFFGSPYPQLMDYSISFTDSPQIYIPELKDEFFNF